MRLILLHITLLISSCCFAQHGPVISQYMLNGLPLNPAFAGSHDALSLAGSYRNQWTGFDGAPITQTFVAHMPLQNESIAGGIYLYNDQIGVSQNQGVYLNGAYRVQLGEGKLSMGLSGGFTFSKNAWSEVITTEEEDLSFVSGDAQYMLPNFGAGLYYYTSEYYISISTPAMLTASYSGGQEYSVDHDMKNYNFYINGGYRWKIDSEFSLLPSLMLRMHSGSPKQVDINLMAGYRELVEAGLSYRTGDAVVAIVKAHVNPQFCVGYAFDHTLSPLSKYNNGTHEVTLQYDFKYKTNTSNPRFF